ncbi:hypothetical protein NMY22_g18769 [Coprinellus aureogranulatus]|nr:hypothetical protein NMY22_g18769 [Coprinellus aureogranulatus]
MTMVSRKPSELEHQATPEHVTSANSGVHPETSSAPAPRATEEASEGHSDRQEYQTITWAPIQTNSQSPLSSNLDNATQTGAQQHQSQTISQSASGSTADTRSKELQQWESLQAAKKNSKGKKRGRAEEDPDLGPHAFVLCGVPKDNEEVVFYPKGGEAKVVVKCGEIVPRQVDKIMEHILGKHSGKLENGGNLKMNKCPWGLSCGNRRGLEKLADHIMQMHVSVPGDQRLCEATKCRRLADGRGDFCKPDSNSPCQRALAWATAEEGGEEDGSDQGTSEGAHGAKKARLA